MTTEGIYNGSETEGIYNPSTHDTVVSNAVTNIIAGITLNMVNGQTPVTVATNNLRMLVSRDAAANLPNMTFTPPNTVTETEYHTLSPSITFADNITYSDCDVGSGYIHMSVMSWGVNPYPGSNNTKTSLFRSQTTSALHTNRVISTQKVTNTSQLAYYITLQYTAKQTFNIVTMGHVRHRTQTIRVKIGIFT